MLGILGFVSGDGVLFLDEESCDGTLILRLRACSLNLDTECSYTPGFQHKTVISLCSKLGMPQPGLNRTFPVAKDDMSAPIVRATSTPCARRFPHEGVMQMLFESTACLVYSLMVPTGLAAKSYGLDDRRSGDGCGRCIGKSFRRSGS